MAYSYCYYNILRNSFCSTPCMQSPEYSTCSNNLLVQLAEHRTMKGHQHVMQVHGSEQSHIRPILHSGQLDSNQLISTVFLASSTSSCTCAPNRPLLQTDTIAWLHPNRHHNKLLTSCMSRLGCGTHFPKRLLVVNVQYAMLPAEKLHVAHSTFIMAYHGCSCIVGAGMCVPDMGHCQLPQGQMPVLRAIQLLGHCTELQHSKEEEVILIYLYCASWLLVPTVAACSATNLAPCSKT